MFLRHPRQVLSRSMIVDHVWDADSENYSNVIDVYVRYLRRKLCEAGETDVIQTVRGFGYRFAQPTLDVRTAHAVESPQTPSPP